MWGMVTAEKLEYSVPVPPTLRPQFLFLWPFLVLNPHAMPDGDLCFQMQWFPPCFSTLAVFYKICLASSSY